MKVVLFALVSLMLSQAMASSAHDHVCIGTIAGQKSEDVAEVSFAKTNFKQLVADAVSTDAEIQAVVKVISDSRGIQCDAPSAKETSVGKIKPSGTKFSAIYKCNEHDQDGQPNANVQQITVKGMAYCSSTNHLGINFQALSITEAE